MLTKFGLLIDFDLPNTVALTSRKPDIVLNCRSRHLAKICDVIFGIVWSDMISFIHQKADIITK